MQCGLFSYWTRLRLENVSSSRSHTRCVVMLFLGVMLCLGVNLSVCWQQVNVNEERKGCSQI